jgi:hypothetical protein
MGTARNEIHRNSLKFIDFCERKCFAGVFHLFELSSLKRTALAAGKTTYLPLWIQYSTNILKSTIGPGVYVLGALEVPHVRELTSSRWAKFDRPVSRA